jgi:hypothetical protein
VALPFIWENEKEMGRWEKFRFISRIGTILIGGNFKLEVRYFRFWRYGWIGRWEMGDGRW